MIYSWLCAGKGSDPEWNETFLFTVSEGVSELNIKIYDSDNIKSDDFVGEATWVISDIRKIYKFFQWTQPTFIE